MHFASLLIPASVSLPIVVSYIAGARYLRRPDSANPRVGFTSKRRLSLRRAATRPQWIDAAELRRLVAADPELVVFHLLDDDPSEFRTSPFENEIALTLPQLEEALPWMPRGKKFAIYQADGITPELAKRLSAITQGRKALLLCGKVSAVSATFDRIDYGIISGNCS
jgi:hypothetical protein